MSGLDWAEKLKENAFQSHVESPYFITPAVWVIHTVTRVSPIWMDVGKSFRHSAMTRNGDATQPKGVPDFRTMIPPYFVLRIPETIKIEISTSTIINELVARNIDLPAEGKISNRIQYFHSLFTAMKVIWAFFLCKTD